PSDVGPPRRAPSGAIALARCRGATPRRPHAAGTCGDELDALLPFAELLLCFVLGDSVALLDLADQLVLLAADVVEVVIVELTPLLLDLALELFPIAFDPVPIHRSWPPVVELPSHFWESARPFQQVVRRIGRSRRRRARRDRRSRQAPRGLPVGRSLQSALQ